MVSNCLFISISILLILNLSNIIISNLEFSLGPGIRRRVPSLARFNSSVSRMRCVAAPARDLSSVPSLRLAQRLTRSGASVPAPAARAPHPLLPMRDLSRKQPYVARSPLLATRMSICTWGREEWQ
jgi:hypothetical protein